MKPKKSSTALLFLVLCGLLIAGVSPMASAHGHRSSMQSDGRLIVKRSPALGYNVTVTVYVDGRLVGTAVRARILDEPIAPGRHLVVARPNRLHGDWHGIVDVRPGETCIYVASCNPKQLYLDPASIFPLEAD
jgi:hypothetical protein